MLRLKDIKVNEKFKTVIGHTEQEFIKIEHSEDFSRAKDTDKGIIYFMGNNKGVRSV